MEEDHHKAPIPNLSPERALVSCGCEYRETLPFNRENHQLTYNLAGQEEPHPLLKLTWPQCFSSSEPGRKGFPYWKFQGPRTRQKKEEGILRPEVCHSDTQGCSLHLWEIKALNKHLTTANAGPGKRNIEKLGASSSRGTDLFIPTADRPPVRM